MLSYCANIVGIDPGTETLGVSVLSFNVCTLDILSIQAQTYYGSKLPGSEWSGLNNGDRFKRIHSHKENLLDIFNIFNPIAVACEAPFYNSLRPSAYGPLVEITTIIKQAVFEYDPWRSVYFFDPPTVKKAIGAPGNASKDIMSSTLFSNPLISSKLVFQNPNVRQLDEHSIDSIAVAFAQYNAYRLRI